MDTQGVREAAVVGDGANGGQGLDPALWFPAPLLEATAVSLETGLVVIVTSG